MANHNQIKAHKKDSQRLFTDYPSQVFDTDVQRGKRSRPSTSHLLDHLLDDSEELSEEEWVDPQDEDDEYYYKEWLAAQKNNVQ